jgi:8-oxo-dGTP diphosphatase
MIDTPSGSPEFYASLPTKLVAAGWLIRDQQDRLLLVEPTYKDPWEIPGGVVESGESPREACRRELREELGIDREPGSLLCVDWGAAVIDVRGDALHLVFDGGVVDEAATASFVLPEEELRSWRFVAPDQLDEYLKPVLVQRLRSCLDKSSDTYLEGGRLS